MKYTLASTKYFDKWLRSLKDRAAKQKILARLARVENGHFGDYKQIDPELYELRFFFSGGVRIYYTIRDAQIVLLLVGGDKSSQKRDIDKAKQLLSELE
jgi:putative addiction module killer protein